MTQKQYMRICKLTNTIYCDNLIMEIFYAEFSLARKLISAGAES